MCNPSESESGQLLTIQPCGWYSKLENDLAATRAALVAAQLRCGDLERENNVLRSDRDRLAGIVKGMEDQNARNLDALRRAEGQNIALQKQIDIFNKERFRVGKENARLREALEFYANDDANAVECEILGSVFDRPATKALKEVG